MRVEKSLMSAIKIGLAERLAVLLQRTNETVQDAAAR